MDLGLEKKVAIVAASSQGLGRSVAKCFADEGARVVICSRNASALEKVKDELQARTDCEILPVVTDLTQPENIKDLVQKTIDTFGAIHVLVNNAGGPPAGFFEDMTDEKWQQGIELTLMSSVRLTREVLPHMKQQKWGRVVNITSISVKQPIDELLLSNSLRLGVLGWAKTLANQVAKDGILINNVCPGWTKTGRVVELFEGRAQSQNKSVEDIENGISNTIPLGRLGKPKELANLVVFLASERASYITGTSIQVDGGSVKGIY